MTRTTGGDSAARDALESHFDSYEVRGLLHEVPPHRTYEVTVDGTRSVCKVATGPQGDPATEARVLQFVDRETAVQVPDVLAVGRDHFVARWHDGVPQSASLDDATARTMGAGLATLHGETTAAVDSYGRFVGSTVDADGTLGPGLGVETHDDWVDAVCAHLADVGDYLDRVGHGDVARATVDCLRERPALLDGTGEPVLCHGNYLPDHVGTADGRVTCVIDFEHALCGPPSYDVWRTLLPLRSDAGDCAAGAFRAGYESVRPLSDGFDRRARVYEAVLTVSYLRSLYLQDQHDAETTRERAEWMREFVFDALDELAGPS
ncbi:phosphotransferase family protein [Haloarchaeobius sp. HRN-SO-5]|uniref:phosphotransferase family protein n=1 Tax=Haloarchaeobius sp. HRN-SO-5 TaxID=3446118 RepID=UPI003EBC5F0A